MATLLLVVLSSEVLTIAFLTSPVLRDKLAVSEIDLTPGRNVFTPEFSELA